GNGGAAANAAGAAPAPAAAAAPAAATAGGAAAPAHAAAAAVNAGAARSTPAMLQGAAAAEVARLPLCGRSPQLPHPYVQQQVTSWNMPPALMPLQQQPPMQQAPSPAGGGTGADAAYSVLHGSALQLQCSLRRLNHSTLADAVATELADKVEADLQQLPQGTQRTQALAQIRSQRHMHSISMAFLNEPMYSTAASFDGLSWQLAVKRDVGVEEQTAGCKLCGKSPGDTLHALCQAQRVKAHDTIVHNGVKRAPQRILQQYLKTGLVDEDYTPFLGSAGPPGSRRMDIVLPADTFPVTDYDDPTRQLPLTLDITCFEAQVASRAEKTVDPEHCCRDQEATKYIHYSGHYDQNCYKLATLAAGSFGSIGAQGQKLLEAVATEYASRMSVPGGARPKALKGIALACLRSALSAALHMAYSGRVMTHMCYGFGYVHLAERPSCAACRRRSPTSCGRRGDDSKVPSHKATLDGAINAASKSYTALLAQTRADCQLMLAQSHTPQEQQLELLNSDEYLERSANKIHNRTVGIEPSDTDVRPHSRKPQVRGMAAKATSNNGGGAGTHGGNSAGNAYKAFICFKYKRLVDAGASFTAHRTTQSCKEWNAYDSQRVASGQKRRVLDMQDEARSLQTRLEQLQFDAAALRRECAESSVIQRALQGLPPRRSRDTDYGAQTSWREHA
ncbi:hypothetical protein JKP88DRAFT_231456, partial [Tribonema minus]